MYRVSLEPANDDKQVVFGLDGEEMILGIAELGDTELLAQIELTPQEAIFLGQSLNTYATRLMQAREQRGVLGSGEGNGAE